MKEYLTALQFIGSRKGQADKVKAWQSHWVEFGPDQGENTWRSLYIVELIKIELTNEHFN